MPNQDAGGAEVPRWALINHQMVQIDPHGEEIRPYTAEDEDVVMDMAQMQARYAEAGLGGEEDGPVFFQASS